jgi:hypothetical protein
VITGTVQQRNLAALGLLCAFKKGVQVSSVFLSITHWWIFPRWQTELRAKLTAYPRVPRLKRGHSTFILPEYLTPCFLEAETNRQVHFK